MAERIGVVEACEFVDQVLADAPLRVTRDFMDQVTPHVALLL